MSGTADIPVSRVEWKGAVRIIRSAFPPIDLFERVADPVDWDALHAIESLTNPRLRDGLIESDKQQVALQAHPELT